MYVCVCCEGWVTKKFSDLHFQEVISLSLKPKKQRTFLHQFIF